LNWAEPSLRGFGFVVSGEKAKRRRKKLGQ
jgi:hypothetical protein